MRMMFSGTVLMGLMMVGSGCESGGDASSGTHSANSADAVMSTKTCIMQSGGRDVLQLTAPADTTCRSWDGILHLESQNRHVEMWLVRGVASVGDAAGKVDELIASEFKGFKPTATTSEVVAGAPATRMLGTGVEADDGDAGQADVVVFRVGGRVFVACAHGESLSTESREWMMALLRTAQAP